MGRKPLPRIAPETIDKILGARSDITSAEIIERAFNKYSSIKGKDYNKFRSLEEITTWWARQYIEQDGRCCYCKTKISDLRRLIAAGLLKTRKAGRDGSGERGPYFEVERCETGGNEYSAENCKLSCYYCNNDKSYIFPADDYEKYMGKAKGEYFRMLLEKLPES